MRLPATRLLRLLQDHRLRVFSSLDVQTLTHLSPPAVSQALQRLARQGFLHRMKRGVWVNHLVHDLHPYEAVPYLTAPWPSYVSLYTALADYGLVEEIPQVIYAISSTDPRRYSTPVGTFDIRYVSPSLIWGYEMKRVGMGSYPLAEPEKAFLDLAYLALVPRSPLQFPYTRKRRWDLDQKKLSRYALRFKFKPLIRYLKKIHLWKEP